MKMAVAMPGPFRTKIGRRLLVAFLALALVPLLVATWVAVDRGRAAVHDQTRIILGTAAEGAEYQVHEYLAHLKLRTHDLASDAVVRDRLEALATLGPCQPIARSACDERKRTLAAELSAYLASEALPLFPRAVEIFVMDASGRVVAASAAARVGADHARQDYFLHGRQAVFVSDFFRDPASGEIAWVVAAPLRSRTSGALLGVIGNRINPRTLSDITTGRRLMAMGSRAQSMRRGETGETYIVNRDKLMITESRFVDAAIMNTVVDSPPVRLALERNQEMTGDYPDYRGVPISGASKIVEETGWVILTEIDFSQAAAPIRQLRNALVGLAIGLGLLGVLVTAALTLRIVRPLRRIAEADLALARGDAAGALIPDDEMPDDEIGAIARSRGKLLGQLAASQAELRQRLKEFSDLNASAALLSQSLSMDEVLGRILDKVGAIFGTDAAEVTLLLTGSGAVVVRAQRGLSPDWLAEERVHPADCSCDWLAQRYEPLCLEDVRPDDTCLLHLACVRDGFLGFWCMPLRAEARVFGVMSLFSRAVRTATPQERDLLSSIGSQIGVALSNITLYQEVQRLSLTDALTGLHNRRALEERLDEEIKRAQRYQHQLSGIMVDIDHFKDYNDAHGHARGDAVLRQVAELIRTQVRETDFVARYGGEEFTVLLPETSKACALSVAEKIRAAVEAQPFADAQTQPGCRLTLSLGVATLPDDVADAQALFQVADQALYRAKNTGRNRVWGG